MSQAFDTALAEAKQFNADIDAQIQDAAMKIVDARQAKNKARLARYEELAAEGCGDDGTQALYKIYDK